jgi:hypothetical protein
MAKRSRTVRREAERATEKVAKEREKLGRLEPGGAPSHAIDVATAAVIEPHARSIPCLRCGEQPVRIEEHEARVIEGQHLRVLRAQCPRCGAKRAIYFRIVPPS